MHFDVSKDEREFVRISEKISKEVFNNTFTDSNFYTWIFTIKALAQRLNVPVFFLVSYGGKVESINLCEITTIPGKHYAKQYRDANPKSNRFDKCSRSHS